MVSLRKYTLRSGLPSNKRFLTAFPGLGGQGDERIWRKTIDTALQTRNYRYALVIFPYGAVSRIYIEIITYECRTVDGPVYF